MKGYKASKCTERKIAKTAGRLTYAFASASVPKVSVIVGEAYGTAYLTMNSMINEKANLYRELQSSAVAAAKRGYVDDIIEACDTRKRVIAAFEMLFTKREDRPDRKHGTV